MSYAEAKSILQYALTKQSSIRVPKLKELMIVIESKRTNEIEKLQREVRILNSRIRKLNGLEKEKYIGKSFDYYCSDGSLRVAIVEGVEWHEGLGKWIFIGVSPYGNMVRLTRDEINRFDK